MAKNPDPCKGCIYQIKFGGYWLCDYITITGHRRPCPFGAGCTVKEAEGGMKKWDESKAYELYQAGASDLEIAHEVGMKPSTICKWRRGKELPAHKGERPSLPADSSPSPAPDLPAPAEAERPAPQIAELQEVAPKPERTSPDGPMELHLELGGGWARIRAPNWEQAAQLWAMMNTCIEALEAGGAADG